MWGKAYFKFLVICLVILVSTGNLQAEQGRGLGGVTSGQKDYALVIGVSNYTNGWEKLPGVKSDIEGVRSVLEKHNFQVKVVKDPDRKKLLKAFDDFISQYGLKKQNRLLFYFAGHGQTIKQSYGEEMMGYIVPTDAPKPDKDRTGFLAKAIDMEQIKAYAKRIESNHTLFVFDSCFSGSILFTSFSPTRGTPENISYKMSNPVCQFITSANEYEKAPDESIFCDYFIAALNGEGDVDKDGYITGTELGEFLLEKVSNDSKGSQYPQHPQHGKILDQNRSKGDFVFKVPPILPSPSPSPESSIQSEPITHEMDMYRWEEVDGCKDNHCGHTHGKVLCHGGALFILRSSVDSSSCPERARSVAEKLNKAMRMSTHKNCKFELKWTRDTPAIFYVMTNSGMRGKIVTITHGDVLGYMHRAKTSDMSLEAERFSDKVGDRTFGRIVVAEWWLAMLTDHLKLMALSDKPTESIDTYYGNVLYKMWKQAKKKYPSGRFPMSIWGEIVSGLPKGDKNKLRMAARIIPKDFAESKIKDYLIQVIQKLGH